MGLRSRFSVTCEAVLRGTTLEDCVCHISLCYRQTHNRETRGCLMEKAALLSSQEHKAEQSVLQAQRGLMLLLITQCYSISGGWGREGQAPSVTKETLQHLVSNIWEMLAQVSGGPLCQPMAMSSVWSSLGAPCAAKEQGPSKAVEAECWLSLLRKFVAVLLRFREGPRRMFSKCLWCKPGLGIWLLQRWGCGIFLCFLCVPILIIHLCQT